MLQIGVGRKCKAFLVAALGVKFYQVAGYVLEFGLGLVFDFLPCSRADAVYLGRHAFLAAVFGEFMKSMN